MLEPLQGTYKLGRIPHMTLQVAGIVWSTAVWVDGEHVYRPLPATDSHPPHIIVPRDILDDRTGSSSLQVIRVNRGNSSGMETSVDQAA